MPSSSIYGRVQLAGGAVDADLAEQAFHAEGARLVRNDGHDVLADVLVLEQLRQDPHEGHGGADLAIARAFQHGAECGQLGDDQRPRRDLARG
jgi:hypothetical protein